MSVQNGLYRLSENIEEDGMDKEIMLLDKNGNILKMETIHQDHYKEEVETFVNANVCKKGEKIVIL